MGKPENREHDAAGKDAVLRLVRKRLMAIVAAIDAVTDTGDADARETVDVETLVRVFGRRLRSTDKELAASQEGDSARGVGEHCLDPRRRLEYALQKKFKTNDTVELNASGWYGDRSVKLSSAPKAIPLGRILDYVVLRALATYAIAKPGQYIRIDDLIVHLQSDSKGLQTRLGDFVADGLSPEELWKSFSRLRRKIAKAGGRKELIEKSSSHGGGFRLSTPPWNIVVSDPIDDDDVEEGPAGGEA